MTDQPDTTHYITLTGHGGEVVLNLICTAAPGADCRKRPADQAREEWSLDDPDLIDGECWAVEWVTEGGWETVATDPEDYYSDEALAKQAALDALPEGELAPWAMLLGIFEPRIEPTADERCTCCGLDARDAEGGRERRGKRWCFICLGRGHDEEDDQ